MIKDRTIRVVIFALIVINILLYAKTATYDFVNFDDKTYVLYNPVIKEITLDNLEKIFSEFNFSNYQPLVHLTYAVEYYFFGQNAAGYHIISVILHILNSILVLYLIFFLSKDSTIAFIVALLFSLHPMQVETIAWISEQKGLLSTFFYLLSFLSYIRYSWEKKKYCWASCKNL